MMFLLRLCLFVFVAVVLRGCLDPLLSSAVWYVCDASLKDSLSDDISMRRLLIANGMLRSIVGGWFDLL